MSTPEIIKDLCDARGITVSALEKELNYSNGALKKGGNIKSERLLEVAKYLNVTMECLMGEPDPVLSRDMAIIQRERSKMTDKEKIKLMNVLAANFDDFNWKDDDSGDIE